MTRFFPLFGGQGRCADQSRAQDDCFLVDVGRGVLVTYLAQHFFALFVCAFFLFQTDWFPLERATNVPHQKLPHDTLCETLSQIQADVTPSTACMDPECALPPSLISSRRPRSPRNFRFASYLKKCEQSVVLNLAGIKEGVWVALILLVGAELFVKGLFGEAKSNEVGESRGRPRHLSCVDGPSFFSPGALSPSRVARG